MFYKKIPKLGRKWFLGTKSKFNVAKTLADFEYTTLRNIVLTYPTKIMLDLINCTLILYYILISYYLY